ncbi:MAG: hypothetical protein UX19_C0002G0072 [Candidatus Woesebacteria bacterium GW2011_GWA1_45_8]|uniref:DUF4446 domain-containing protein n=1 Tax=Candidatus Woesebacteria bacterium GW2011_GWA1_45_8 TaxID=1618559 RepID=A0A0G1QUM8_9BACT|nr:MAG: hypothetical protein UX19_C0002G0072 [Candidatus Woesebacteria bacterium GW2011_GWA1_45_8]
MPKDIFFLVTALWLTALTVAVFWVLRLFLRLSAKVKGENLQKVLERILEGETLNAKNLSALKVELERQRDEARLHIQKVGIVRFNPFKEIGGDHSFSLALLDGKDTGIVLTGIHTRERTRIYTKQVRNGKCEFELSNEEKRALIKAQKGEK